MEFKYVPCEGLAGTAYRPYLPITFSFGMKRFPVGHALVDTGADISLLPMDIARFLGVVLDEEQSIEIENAGGGKFVAVPSKGDIRHSIEGKGFRPIHWNSFVYFAPRQPIVLLGHKGCLERFDLLFKGTEKMLRIE